MSSTARVFNNIVETRRSVRIYNREETFDSGAVKRSLERAVLSPNSSNLQLWEFYQVKSEARKKELSKLCLSQPAAETANELVVVVVRRDLWKKRIKFNLDVLKKSFEKSGVKMEKARATKDSGGVLSRIADDKGARQRAVLQYYGKLMPQLYKGDRFGFFGRIKKIFVRLFLAPKGPTVHEVGYTDTRIIAHKSAALAAQTFMLSMTAEGYDTCPMEGIDTKRIKRWMNLPRGAEISMVIACGKAKPEGIYGPRIRVPNEEVIFEM